VTAQNVLPVIDDPEITLTPWPIQTTPVRKSTAPSTRLAMVTQVTTCRSDDRFAPNPRPGSGRCPLKQTNQGVRRDG
jgi:hypothetical protein